MSELDRDAVLMYAYSNGYAVSTARKHFREGLAPRADHEEPYRQAGRVLAAAREFLPPGSFFAFDGHILHRNYGVIFVVPDELVDDFLEEKFDALKDRLDTPNVRTIEVLTRTESETNDRCCGRFMTSRGKVVEL